MSDPQEIKKPTRGGFRPGAGRPKGIPQREGQKNASRAHLIRRRLLDHGLGKIDMVPSQVKALEVLLDRLEPRLSAVEHTEANPRDAADPGALLQQLQALIAEKPHLLELLKAPQQSAETVPQDQVKH